MTIAIVLTVIGVTVIDAVVTVFFINLGIPTPFVQSVARTGVINMRLVFLVAWPLSCSFSLVDLLDSIYKAVSNRQRVLA